MTLRLDTYPEAQIASHMTPIGAASPSPTLCCLLHTGTLPTTQHLRVTVRGSRQIAKQEGTQQVFSWQCTEGTEMSISLMQHGRLVKAWRGWWQGETTIAHTGTLSVQVLCAGVSQPAGLLPTLANVSGMATDRHNGSHPEAVSEVHTWPEVPEPATPSLPPIKTEPENDLWSTFPSDSGGIRQKEVPEEETEPSIQEQERRQEAAQKEEESLEERPERQGEAEHPETTPPDPTQTQVVVPTGTMLASLPAPTVWSQPAHQEAEAQLATLLASMPANTILVDLRQHRPTPPIRRSTAKNGPQKLGLSKELLRTLYGGRYWDRGSAIQTTRHLLSAHPLRWCRVVLNASDPDGLGTLVTALAQGFSLVLLDGETHYAESPRAAVLAELRLRVTNLSEGPCS